MNKSAPPSTSNAQARVKALTSNWSTMAIIGSVFGAIAWLIYAIGAAKLSYDKYGSIGWAIPAFILSWIYYPYYAFFVSTRIPMMGGRRR